MEVYAAEHEKSKEMTQLKKRSSLRKGERFGVVVIVFYLSNSCTVASSV